MYYFLPFIVEYGTVSLFCSIKRVLQYFIDSIYKFWDNKIPFYSMLNAKDHWPLIFYVEGGEKHRNSSLHQNPLDWWIFTKFLQDNCWFRFPYYAISWFVALRPKSLASQISSLNWICSNIIQFFAPVVFSYWCLVYLAGLVDAIREDVSILTLLAEALCLLDMIVNSFANTISIKPVDRYTRPEFTGAVHFSLGQSFKIF